MRRYFSGCAPGVERTPDDVLLPEQVVREYFDHFEAPTPDEGPLTVVR